MLQRLIVLVGASLLALALVLTGCGGGAAAGEPEAVASATTAEQAAFPVTVEGDNGSVEIAAEPTRIVSLSATATESLFAIGAGDQVLAVDDQSNHPPEAPVTKLSGFQPNIEAIAGYEPDLVIAAYDPGGLVDGLEALGIPVLLQDAARDLDAAYEQIRTLGTVTGHVAEADEVAASMQERIDELVGAAPSEGLSVYHELGLDYFSATSNTFIGSIYERLGLHNIADDAKRAGSDYPQLSVEHIVSSNPDLIVLADTKCCGQSAETVAARPGWGTIAAVTEGRIVEADDDITSRWGPRTVEFVELVVRVLEEL